MDVLGYELSKCQNSYAGIDQMKVTQHNIATAASNFFFLLFPLGLCTLGPYKVTHLCKGNACDWLV
jgi:hypothetical protein